MNSNHEELAFAPKVVLGLPAIAHQPGRIHKKTLIDQAASQTTDAALITRAVAGASVEAVLRAENVKIPAHADGQRRVDDIAVFHVDLSESASAGDVSRLVELLHRSMPRPLILFLTSPRDGELLSLALTHLNLGDPDRATSVVDRSVVVPLRSVAPGALRLDQLNRSDLWTFYRDMVRVAAADGQPASTSLSVEDALDLRGRLASLQSELQGVVRDAQREKSQARRIDLNTRARDLRQQIETVAGSLYSPTRRTDRHPRPIDR
ncbi:DUF4391 domain-containing protein [Oryzihumus leptocrescens]|uniref:Uncharacterized protein DUF4391 n=1 Tax=Oryzihumus leptocrescens TaxID=297536 RepID=A0A542ZKV9_9MICO|nr:DUF4391 domain-containing protein [Oryzihumus leptocrescens]TQL60985.1 uncharacterized protein DUF4391 [Oryzihumus leptocrescens]